MWQSRHLAAYVVPRPPALSVSGTKKVKEGKGVPEAAICGTHTHPYRILFAVNSSFAPPKTLFLSLLSVFDAVFDCAA